MKRRRAKTLLPPVSIVNRFVFEKVRLLNGLYQSRFRRGAHYQPERWWDEVGFARGIGGDHDTVAAGKSRIAAAYHYASIELLILRELRESHRDLVGAEVCDLGSGSGHWIDFYLGLRASRCTAIDISKTAVEYLNGKYASRSEVMIRHGRIVDVLRQLEPGYDLVSAIGVMFHIVDDEEWQEVVQRIGSVLKPGGLFIAGGHFGWFDGVNVQWDPETGVNKRLRSAQRWRRVVERAGFDRPKISRNRAYLFIRDRIPENNVLIARKRTA